MRLSAGDPTEEEMVAIEAGLTAEQVLDRVGSRSRALPERRQVLADGVIQRSLLSMTGYACCRSGGRTLGRRLAVTSAPAPAPDTICRSACSRSTSFDRQRPV